MCPHPRLVRRQLTVRAKLTTNGLISHKESGFETRHCIWDMFNIWQMTLGTYGSISYGLYCCNYDVKVAICDGRIVTLQFKDVSVKYNSLKLVIACGNVSKMLGQGWYFSVILWMYCTGMCLNGLMLHLCDKSAMDWIKALISSEPAILPWRYRIPRIRGPMCMLAVPTT